MNDPLTPPAHVGPSGSESSHAFSFMSFGVAIRIETNRREHLDAIRAQLEALLVGHVDAIGDGPVDHVCSVHAGEDGQLALFLDGEALGGGRSEYYGLQYLCTRIKALITETTQSHVLVHAGVVALGDRAVVMPAHSCQGKTTLVRALVSRGAVYYSDDMAVFDRDGLVHPLPKTLSVRLIPGQYDQVEYSVESLGGVAGDRPLRVALVLFTGFDAEATWNPREISPGRAVLKLLEHTGSVSTQPRVAMAVLSKVVSGGTILWESARGDAAEAAEQVIDRLRQVAVGPAPC